MCMSKDYLGASCLAGVDVGCLFPIHFRCAKIIFMDISEDIVVPGGL